MKNVILQSVRAEGMIPHKIKRGKADWIGYILLINCLLSRTVEGKKEGDIDGTGKRGRRCRQILNNLKKKRRHLKLKEKAVCVISLHHTPRGTRFGRSYGPAVGRRIV